MMLPQNHESDFLPEEEESPLPGETIRYLAHVENKLYQDIQSRKRIDSGLLFLACQISSCSLSWVLFNLQVTLLVIQVISAVISLLPGLIDIGDSFNFSITSDSWQFTLGEKPLVGVVKFIIGGAVSFSGTSKITAEVVQTRQVIAQTYSEIRTSEGLSWQLPDGGMALLIAAAAGILIGLTRKLSITNTQDKKDEV